jgi:hypothetical protein
MRQSGEGTSTTQQHSSTNRRREMEEINAGIEKISKSAMLGIELAKMVRANFPEEFVSTRAARELRSKADEVLSVYRDAQ